MSWDPVREPVSLCNYQGQKGQLAPSLQEGGCPWVTRGVTACDFGSFIQIGANLFWLLYLK